LPVAEIGPFAPGLDASPAGCSRQDQALVVVVQRNEVDDAGYGPRVAAKGPKAFAACREYQAPVAPSLRWRQWLRCTHPPRSAPLAPARASGSRRTGRSCRAGGTVGRSPAACPVRIWSTTPVELRQAPGPGVQSAFDRSRARKRSKAMRLLVAVELVFVERTRLGPRELEAVGAVVRVAAWLAPPPAKTKLQACVRVGPLTAARRSG